MRLSLLAPVLAFASTVFSAVLPATLPTLIVPEPEYNALASKLTAYEVRIQSLVANITPASSAEEKKAVSDAVQPVIDEYWAEIKAAAPSLVAVITKNAESGSSLDAAEGSKLVGRQFPFNITALIFQSLATVVRLLCGALGLAGIGLLRPYLGLVLVFLTGSFPISC